MILHHSICIVYCAVYRPDHICAAAKTEPKISYEDVDQNRIEQNKEPKMSHEYAETKPNLTKQAKTSYKYVEPKQN